MQAAHAEWTMVLLQRETGRFSLSKRPIELISDCLQTLMHIANISVIINRKQYISTIVFSNL